MPEGVWDSLVHGPGWDKNFARHPWFDMWRYVRFGPLSVLYVAPSDFTSPVEKRYYLQPLNTHWAHSSTLSGVTIVLYAYAPRFIVYFSRSLVRTPAIPSSSPFSRYRDL